MLLWTNTWQPPAWRADSRKTITAEGTPNGTCPPLFYPELDIPEQNFIIELVPHERSVSLNMNTLEAIRTRRSIRKFQDKKVPREILEQIVADAAYAPSWKNTQIARYHIIEDQDVRKTIAEEYTLGFAYNTGTLTRAPQVVVLSAKKGRSGMEKDGTCSTSKGESWLMFDAGVAAQTFCLAAWEHGVGSVIMGIFDAEKVAELLQLPEDEVAVALIPVGYPDEAPNAPKRKPVEELVQFH